MPSTSNEILSASVLVDAEFAEPRAGDGNALASVVTEVPLAWRRDIESTKDRGDATAQVPHVIPPPPSFSFHKIIVSAYRIAGFSILTIILVGLFSYLSSQLFFLVNRSWIAPTIVSPTDERVMQLSTQFAELASQRDKLIAERGAIVAQLNDAKRTVTMNAEYQGAFTHALQADLAGRRAELSSVQTLVGRYRAARGEIEKSNEAYAGMSRTRLQDERKAGLIENDQYVNGNYQIAQIAHANLSLVEKESELSDRATSLRRATTAFEAAMPRGSSGALSYEMLKIKQELSRSELDEKRAHDNVGAFTQSIAALDAVIARYDRLLKGVSESPYLLATERNMTVAFVPYDNLGSVGKDAPIYACRVGMLWCRRVGSVINLLGSEVSNKHPLRSDMLRGQMVQIDLRDAGAAKDRVLYTNRAPLFL